MSRNGTTEIHRVSLFDYLRQEIARRQVEAQPELPFDFVGGYVGYFGYELKQCSAVPGHYSTTPDAVFIFADRLLAFDHAEQTLWLVCLTLEDEHEQATAWLDRMQARLAAPLPEVPVHYGSRREPVMFQLRHDRTAYLQRIQACLAEIRDGESYEICLTNKIRTRTRPHPLDLYRVLRHLNPAPYSAFLHFGGIQVMCSSPERFLKIDRDRMLEAKPIKGTIARGRDLAEDTALKEALRASEKERAENLMIVDLLRNDLGLVSELY